MSDSNASYDDDDDYGDFLCNSTQDSGYESAASSIPSPAKRQHSKKYTQISGKAWVFHGEITTYQLSADLDSAAIIPGLEDHKEEEDDQVIFLRLQSRLKVKLGDTFELFLGAKAVHIKYFVIYCDLGMMLQRVSAHDGASKVKIQV